MTDKGLGPELFHAAFESASDAIIIGKDDGSILVANGAACRLFGRTQGEMKALSRQALMEESPLLRSALEERARTGAYRGKLSYRYVDGSLRLAEVTSTSFLDGLVVLVLRDVTDRTKAADALFQSEVRARAVFENQSDELTLLEPVVTDRGEIVDWRYTHANEGALRSLKKSREEVVGRTLRELFPDRSERTGSLLAAVLDSKVTQTYETGLEGGEREVRLFRVDEGLVGAASHEVTREREAERALKASEIRLRTVLDGAPIALLLYELKGRLAYANAAAMNLFRKDVEEAVGRKDEDLFPKNVTDVTSPRLSEACRGREQFFELAITEDGTQRWFSVNYVPLKDQTGVLEQVLGVVIEVTDARRVEAALRAQLAAEERLAHLAASVPGAFFTSRLGTDGRLSMPVVSEAARELFGLDLEELAQSMDPIHLRTDPADRARHREVTEASARNLTPWHDVWRYQHPTKGVRILEAWCMPQRELDGSTVWNGFFMDVTAQHEAQEALREAAAAQLDRERQLDTVLRTAIDGFLVVDADGRIVEANDAFCAMTGYSRAELLTRNIGEIDAAPTPGTMSARLDRLRTLGADRFEALGRRKDGTTFDLDMSVSCHGDRQFAFVRDISARKQAEADLRRSRMELRALAIRLQTVREEEKARIARDLHDDLGQALTGLQFELRFLEDRIEARDPSEENLALLDRAVSASGLASEMLDKVQRITRELRPTALDQLGLAAALRQELRDFEMRTGLKVDASLTTEGPLAEDVSTALYRICQEALTNVARHASARTVSVCLEEREDDLVLEVTDDGMGIPVDAAKRPTSLGILGMRERARSIGGRLFVLRGPVGGTVVTTSVPRMRARRNA